MFRKPLANRLTGDGLFRAAENGDFQAVQRYFMLDSELTLRGRNEHGKTALHLAAQFNHFPIVMFLVDNKAPVNTQDGRLRTPLHSAVVKGNNDIVIYLLEERSDPRITDFTYSTALHLAVYSDNERMVDILSNHNDNARYFRNCNNQTALHIAAEKGGFNVMKTILRYGDGDKDFQDNLGQTALHLAVETGNIENVRLLFLKNAARADIQDLTGQTSLHRAALSGNCEVVAIIGTKHPNIDAKDDQGETALYIAARKEFASIVEYLLKEGANASIVTNTGHSAEDCTINENIRKIIETTKGYGRNQTEPENSKQTQKSPPEPPPGHKRYLDNFKARITYFTDSKKPEPRDVGVCDLLYGSKLEEGSENDFSLADKSLIRWIHLPLNNKTWIMHLIERICALDGKSENYCQVIKSFVERYFWERKAEMHESYFRQPHFRKEYSSESTMISLVMQYFDHDSISAIKKNIPRKQIAQQLYPEAIHWPQSLDQSYYLAFADMETRDKDQVLTKSLENRPNVLLMVPQFWLWQIDSRTIISSCPMRLDDGSQSAKQTITGSLKKSFDEAWIGSKPPPPGEELSVERLVSLAVQNCLSFFDYPWNSGLDDPASLTFAKYIAKQSEREIDFRQMFLEPLRERRSGVTSVDIQREIACLKEVKDILDEVKIINSVLQNQLEVFEQVLSNFEQLKISHPQYSDKREEPIENDGSLRRLKSIHNQLSFNKTIHVLRQRWKNLNEDALGVERSLNHLLDLKQKQASLDEAVSASKEAKSAAIQNRAVIIFTVVTVIFAPLSFITSLYALDYFKPSEKAQKKAGGWNQNRIGSALGLAIGVVLAVLMPVIVLTVLPKSYRDKILCKGSRAPKKGRSIDSRGYSTDADDTSRERLVDEDITNDFVEVEHKIPAAGDAIA